MLKLSRQALVKLGDFLAVGDGLKLCINGDGNKTGCRQVGMKMKSMGTGGNGNRNNLCQCASL